MDTTNNVGNGEDKADLQRARSEIRSKLHEALSAFYAEYKLGDHHDQRDYPKLVELATNGALVAHESMKILLLLGEDAEVCEMMKSFNYFLHQRAACKELANLIVAVT
jgi:hypothetical protein